MRSGVGAKRRKFWLIATSALAPLSLGVSEPALAQCAGPLNDVKCTIFGNTYSVPIPGNAYQSNAAGGINVGGGNTDELKVTLEPGVNVVIPNIPGPLPPSPNGFSAVNAANSATSYSSSADVTIIALDGVIINNTANPLRDNNTGLRIQSSGNAIINTTNTQIDVAGTQSDWAILAFHQFQSGPTLGPSRDVSVNWSGPRLTSTTGIEGGGIQADNRGNGNAIVVASGDVNVVTGTGVGPSQYGLLAHAGDPTGSGMLGAGDASVTYNSGTIKLDVARPRGILAWVDGNGSARVKTEAGTVHQRDRHDWGRRSLCLFERHGHRAERVKSGRGIAYHECWTGDHRRSLQPSGRYSSQ
jgi:hypothetical protein